MIRLTFRESPFPFVSTGAITGAVLLAVFSCVSSVDPVVAKRNGIPLEGEPPVAEEPITEIEEAPSVKPKRRPFGTVGECVLWNVECGKGEESKVSSIQPQHILLSSRGAKYVCSSPDMEMSSNGQATGPTRRSVFSFLRRSSLAAATNGAFSPPTFPIVSAIKCFLFPFLTCSAPTFTVSTLFPKVW